jgi:enamine deaminase RidA (YjgF/YER057c/UK114 family)
MPTRVEVKTDKAPPPLPFYSQAIICNGMVYCSGSLGMDPESKTLVETGIGDRTVS